MDEGPPRDKNLLGGPAGISSGSILETDTRGCNWPSGSTLSLFSTCISSDLEQIKLN